ncbi:MAG TPA: hypothetical protein VGB64_04490 [Actinomycetota bacterium]
MRNFTKKMLIMTVALAAVAVGGIGNAADIACPGGETSSFPSTRRVVWTQSNSCVVEPLLSRSDGLLVYVKDGEPDNLGEANLKSIDFQTVGDNINVKLATAERIPRNINEFPQTTGAGVRAPYGGVHVLALFQTPQLQTTQVMGLTATGGTATFGPYNIQDNYHFFVYYGITASSGATPTCGWGIYDQFGQLFSVFSQSHVDSGENFSCVNNGAGLITMNFKYRTNWRLEPEGLNRTIELVKAGQRITNVKGFTWMDHEVGGPPPVGLVVGLTHYTDVIPKAGYDFGAWVGDPNSGGVPTHTCSRYPIIGTVPNPLATGSACYASLSASGVGLGMRPTSLAVNA